MHHNHPRIGPLVTATLIACASPALLAQSLTQVVKNALDAYPQVRAANSKVEAARSDIGRAQSAHYPQISLSTSLNSFASGGTPSSLGSANVSPAAKLNLWSGGRIQADVDKSQALLQAAQSALKTTRDDVALSAVEAYVSWAKAIELESLAQTNLQVHEEIANDIAKIVTIDQGRRVDLQQALVRKETAALTAQQRRSETVLAAQKVRRFAGDKLGSEPLPLDFELSARGPLGRIPASMEDALAQLSPNTPSLSQYVAQVEAAKANLKQVQGLKYPTVDLNVGRQYSANTQKQEMFSQITLNMPVYNGGQISAQIETAQAQLQTAEFNLEDAKMLASEKVSLAWQEWSATSQRANLANSQVNIADKLIEGYRAQFRIGRRSLLDLLNVQSDAFTHASSARSAFHDERISRARVLGAMDTLAQRFDEAVAAPQAPRASAPEPKEKPVVQEAKLAVVTPVPTQAEPSRAVVTPPLAQVQAAKPGPAPVKAELADAGVTAPAVHAAFKKTSFTLGGDLFKFRGSSMEDFTPAGRKELDKIIAMMTTSGTARVQITGYTDGLGTDAINIPLSQKRANAVREYMMDAGVKGSGITATGKGSDDPVKVCPGTRAERIICEAPNRRVVIELGN